MKGREVGRPRGMRKTIVCRRHDHGGIQGDGKHSHLEPQAAWSGPQRLGVWVGLVDCIEGARGRKVPRGAERAPQDDKNGESVKRSEEVGHQGGGVSGIGGTGLPKLEAHPFLLHAALVPDTKKMRTKR
jgi:hypothetical protein